VPGKEPLAEGWLAHPHTTKLSSMVAAVHEIFMKSPQSLLNDEATGSPWEEPIGSFGGGPYLLIQPQHQSVLKK
jgi:hypothetical protein